MGVKWLTRVSKHQIIAAVDTRLMVLEERQNVGGGRQSGHHHRTLGLKPLRPSGRQNPESQLSDMRHGSCSYSRTGESRE